MISKKIFVPLLFVSNLSVLVTVAESWYRGNTHVHTVLSGHGDSSPEYVAKWYHDRGYHFLILREHNKFIDPKTVELPANKREDFILIPGQEITGKPVGVHTTAMNIDGLIDWANKETDSKGDVIQDHIHKTVEAGGQPILNHPHGGSSITSEDIRLVRDFHMMELYNANTKRNNLFKRRYLNLPLTSENTWDDLLTEGRRVYGVGSDDAHMFLKVGPNETNAGLGWVMVRSDRLDPDSIMDAMKRGDFYASNGIVLKSCNRGSKSYDVKVDVEKTRKLLLTLPEWAGLETRETETGYRIEFVGPGGKTLQATSGPEASYSLKKLDTYVRVCVVFARKKENVIYEEFFAWGQPAFEDD